MTGELDRTVIVVGAGASFEFGLPVGTKLQELIKSLTSMDRSKGGYHPKSNNREFFDLLPRAVGLERMITNDYIRLAKKSHFIAMGVEHAASIDNFLHAHQADSELVNIGKLAIAACILKAEKECSLAYAKASDELENFPHKGEGLRPSDTWIGLLIKALSAGKNFEEFCAALATITFVCFNYDRCIERYVYAVSLLIYPQEEYDLTRLSDALTIIHPYGFLGDIRPQDGGYGTFGKLGDPDFILSASQGIRTFTEGMESNVIQEIGFAFENAQNAVFLGYGFISVNDEFLFNNSPFEIPRVLGTTYGISSEKADFISNKLKSKCMMWKTPHDGWKQRGQPQLRSEGCSDLLHRFSHVFETIGT